MRRARAASLLVMGTATLAFGASFALTLMVARQDYEITSYAQLFELQNIPAVLVYSLVGTMILMIIAALPLTLGYRRIMTPEWRRRRGECPGCGYELQGVSRCPECGRDAPAA